MSLHPFLPTLRAQWLGEQLRTMRQQRKMTPELVAAHLNCDHSSLLRYERAEWPIRRSDVVALLDLYGQHDADQRHNLLIVAENVWRVHLWEFGPYPEVDRSILTLGWLASRAAKICLYQPALDADSLAAAVKQAGETPVESVIDGEDYGDQVDELDQLAARTGAQVLALPKNTTYKREAFTLFVMPEPYPPVATQDGLAGHVVVESPMAERFADTYRHMREATLTTASTADLSAAPTE